MELLRKLFRLFSGTRGYNHGPHHNSPSESVRVRGGGHIYLIGHEGAVNGTKLVKIGWTKGPVINRMKDLQTGSPVRLVHHCTVIGNRRVESALHHAFRKYRVRSDAEWFELPPDWGHKLEKWAKKMGYPPEQVLVWEHRAGYNR